MARLPVPGSDENTWGDVLNDYLSQVHKTDGTLKDGSVGNAQLQSGAVTSAKLAAGAVNSTHLVAGSVGQSQLATGAVTNTKVADGAITASKLAADINNSTKGIRSLLIFYAPPNAMNGKFSDDYAAGVLARYDDVVLGGGLQDPGHAYYASTTAIIQKVAALSPDTVVWGYINVGVTTGNLSLATLQTHIDQWTSIGARGIFCDTIGYAYQVPRSRQNAVLDYIHSKEVGAIINVFNPDEVLSSAVDATYNPSGIPTSANANDVLLLESWVCNSDAYSTPFYATFSDVRTRGDAARVYRTSLGIRLFAVNIISHTGRSESELNEYRGVAEGLARVWRLDGSGMAASTYSASGSDVALVAPRFSQFRNTALRPTAPFVLNGGLTEVEASDLGIIIHYESSSHTWQQR